jgi:acetolactate synthase-1/2/3 large subunit
MTLAVLSESHASELRVPAAAVSLADQLVVDLANFGINTYFGVPGGAIEPLFNALARQQAAGRIKLVPMRSEAGAGFAADGYYRATGKIAVCTGTTGPGIANLLTATMAAHADRIPMLLLTPQVALPKEGRGALQESGIDGYDLPRILAECTRYSTTVTHPKQLVHKLLRALSTALSAPMGPVHLSIPSDILAGPAAMSATLDVCERGPASQPIDLVGVERLIRALLEAPSPVLYIGDDAGPAAARLCQVARAIGACVITSPAGKRWIGHCESVYKGVLGFSGHVAALEAARSAGIIVAFGATFDELSTNAWGAFPPGVPVYSVDKHAEHAYRVPHVRSIIAETAQVVSRILERLPSNGAGRSGPKTVPPPRLVQTAANGPVHPSDLMRWLSHNLPHDVVVHVDAGNSFSWSTRELVRSKPDTYRVAMGLSTMCWGIGAAIGATIGHRRRTLCICGDGSMLMSGLELTVAVEQKLPVTYVILNDSGLGMVRHGQRLGGAESIAHEIAPVRFDWLAKACGAQGMRVERIADLDAVPEPWLAADDEGPAVIDVHIDRNVVPPIGDRVLGLAAGVSR